MRYVANILVRMCIWLGLKVASPNVTPEHYMIGGPKISTFDYIREYLATKFILMAGYIDYHWVLTDSERKKLDDMHNKIINKILDG